MLLEHAKHELALLRSGEPDPEQDAIEADILALVERFSDQGHSGSTAAYTIGILGKLLRFEPLTPLTGADDEWTEVGPDGLLQNKRCSHVFKDAERGAYDIQAVVFQEPNGVQFTNSESFRPVTFPYLPKTTVVLRNSSSEA